MEVGSDNNKRSVSVYVPARFQTNILREIALCKRLKKILNIFAKGIVENHKKRKELLVLKIAVVPHKKRKGFQKLHANEWT